MKQLMILSLLLTSTAWAGPKCTEAPKGQWQNQAEFEKNLAKDYEIKVFKVTPGNCYEIYGKNKSGKNVEIYFNPVTGEKVKEKVQ